MALSQGSAKGKTINRAWWKESSVYQIYPASFKDSNGDGVGDIPGIISELDYIKKLGIDIVWLSPILQSPQIDMGYDISNYYDIHPPYGTLNDVDRLIEGLHARGMKYVMDLVFNHTSDQHEWFKQSRSSKDNPYRNWYIWRKPRYDADGKPQPPNNWRACFGGSAWEFDPSTNEYYLHLYAVEQPDLNWDHPPVRDEVHRLIRHWLDKGVDGFRIDVINFVSKHPDMPDAPITNPTQKWQDGSRYYACGPRLHEYLFDIGKILKEYDAFSVGEMPCVFDPVEILKAVNFDRNELNMVFHFEIVDMDHGPTGKYTPGKFQLSVLKTIVSKWQEFMYANDGWNALYIENHDQGRGISRFATQKPELRAIAGKMLATFLGFQSGTPFVYQGQELGMVNVPESWGIEDFRDIDTLNAWNELIEAHPDDKELQRQTLVEMRLKSRDNGRTPMQWNAQPQAGFTSATATPWIKVHDDYGLWNAEAQVSDPQSVYTFWGQVLRLRKQWMDVFVYGDYVLVDEANQNVFAYTRTFGSTTALIVCSFSENVCDWTPPADLASVVEKGKVICANYGSPVIKQGAAVELRALESFVSILDRASA